MAIETLGAALRELNRLFAEGVSTGLSDARLLERFLSQRDPGAFEVLVGRHGPMVMAVCRAILRDQHDAEDAFQATFLVLVKKGATIRGRDALAGWLHQVGASRRDPGQYRRGPAAHARKASGRDGPRDDNKPRRQPRMICCRHCTKRSPACPRSTVSRSSTAT